MDIRRFKRAVLAVLGWDREPPPIDYMLFYPATVEVAAADGTTVDLRPKDSRIPPHQGVPLRSGIPGAVAVVQPGAVVLLGWEKGDPAGYYAVPAWELGAKLTSLKFVDAANDSIEIGAGIVTVKIGGTQVLKASATSLALGLLGTLPFLYQGSVDSIGVPVTNNPAASASIVKGG